MKPIFAVLCLCVSTTAAAQDALDPARQLYASADYEGALTALERVQADSGDERKMEVEKYRVLCLVALGRSAEADAVIERMLKTDPLYEPSLADAPPRIRTAFGRVRDRVLPSLARATYDAGKAAFDQKQFDHAAAKLDETLRILDQAGESETGDLADLRTLAKGFLDLSRASLTPASAKNAVAEPPRQPTAAATNTAADAVSNPAAEAPNPVPGPPRPDSDPIAKRQVLPPWSNNALGALSRVEYRGTIEVDIDEGGRVVGAEITRSIHPLYDPALLKASREWLYEPAYRDGQPVRIRKRVDIVLQPR